MDIKMREKYEWSNYWWDNANDIKLPRILLIGDSISVGYRPYVAKLLANKRYVDLMATSKGVNDISFKKELQYILGEYKYDIIHFNNGLHALHLKDEDYKINLIKCIKLIKSIANNSKIIWASSTPITKLNDTKKLDVKNKIVIHRNNIAKEIMKNFDIPINDLYSIMLHKNSLKMDDGYHYNEDGKKLQGQAVANICLNQLN